MFEIEPDMLEKYTRVLEGSYQRNKNIFENPSFLDGCHYGAYMASLTILSLTIDKMVETEDLNKAMFEAIITAKAIHEASSQGFSDISGKDLQAVMQPLIDHVNKCDASYEKKGFRTKRRKQ